MKKHVTKIICAGIAAVVATSVGLAAGCSQYNKGVNLDYTHTDAVATSNGGFAVEKDGYVYFINGPESSGSNNNYGTPVKGSIMRIAVEDLNNGNYNAAKTLVPQIAYSTNYSTGIFIYGDYIYYGTPSTKRNSDGEILSSNLEMKRTKLDGTESMKSAYVTFPSAAYNYRFVEVEGVVYLMYVATAETLYNESEGVTNLHSYNTVTGVDTLLAYNVSNYTFDAEDSTNPRVYYTMNVYNYSGTSNSAYSYNQVYTVTADTTEQNEYNFDEVLGWDADNDHYVNCGDLVFDGIGGKIFEATPFNYKADGTEVNDMSYSYTLETYLNNTLFYTRTFTLSSGSTSSAYLFSVKDSELASTWNPVAGNLDEEEAILQNGSYADAYKYIFNESGELSAVLTTENGGVAINKVTDGKLSEKINNTTYFRIVKTGTATMLFTDGNYLYYSLTGSNNGYAFYRIDYTGNWGDYEGMHGEDTVTDYTAVRVLDLDAANDWYMPELISGYLFYAGESQDMSAYNYIMAFNIGKYDTNAKLDELNELYNGIVGTDGIIADYADTDKYPKDIYANLGNAARYMFYTADIDYVTDLAKACNAKLGEDDDPVYSENTLNKLKDFLAAEGDWADYKEYVRKVNGQDVYGNRRDYYYSVIGKMTEKDAENYVDGLKASYLKAWPQEEEAESWYKGLSTVERVFFIIGMCLIGILVIGGATVLVVVLVRKARKNKQPNYAKRRIKVDTTDDKNINVYEDETAERKE